MQDRIEKTVELKASVARVWTALTDHKEFGEWFRVRLDGPFEVGELSTGQVTYPGCEHMKWEARVETMDPDQGFSFRWCPLDDSSEEAFDSKPTTLVEFKLEPTAEGTRLLISESGFASLPEGAPRNNALRSNTQGWNEQAKNIAAHVER